MVLSEMSSSSNSRMSLRSVALLASVLSFRASERRRSIILWGSRTRPSRRLASDSATCSMYERGASALRAGATSMLPGHPPRMIRSTRAESETSPVGAMETGRSNRLEKLTTALESPDSESVMGNMRMVEMRPVPVCMTPFCGGVEDPLSRYRPLEPPRSTSKRTASQIPGTSCHSSMRCGASPTSVTDGSISAIRLFWNPPAGSPT